MDISQGLKGLESGVGCRERVGVGRGGGSGERRRMQCPLISYLKKSPAKNISIFVLTEHEPLKKTTQ